MSLLSKKYIFALTLCFACLSFYTPIIANAHSAKVTSAQVKLQNIEHSFAGHIGIYAINTANQQAFEFNSAKRFPIQSTFKFMLVADALKQSIKNKDFLNQKIMIKKDELVFWSPIAKKYLAKGMTISNLCAAIIMYSDNTAANLLMKKLGGPKAITEFAHSIIPNTTFTLESLEPNLNSNPNIKKDTATPADMLKSLQILAFSNFLDTAQRKQLITWLKNSTTGKARIKAGVPSGWIVGDKTGTGSDFGVSNDIGIIWPPKCKPIIMAIYTVRNKKEAPPQNKVVAQAASLVLSYFAKSDQCIARALS